MKKNIPKLLTIFILSLLFSGCAHKAYNPDEPQEYIDYWSDEKNVKNSILYPYSDNCRENNEHYCR